MVFKTLHWYIFRELLRIFALTASALTTLLAFGGTFRPFTKRGIEVGQLMTIMMNLMPAMLAYAIPIAALFAAVLVYWRLSTDNELTACRASGISFVTIVMPALFLGVVVASTDLVFVNYVVPVFLQRTERAISSDLGSLLVSQIGRQEKFEFDKYVIYADSATQEPTTEPNTSIVKLTAMAATVLKDGKPTLIGIAREAIVTIRVPQNSDGEVQLSAHFVDAAAFDPKTFQKASGSLDSQFFGEDHHSFPSILKSKPKFVNLKRLFEFRHDPSQFQPVRDIIERIVAQLRYQAVGQRLYEEWRTAGRGEKPVVFAVNGYSPNAVDELRVYGPRAMLNSEQQLVYKEIPGTKEVAGVPVRVEQYSRGKLLATFTCGEADVVLFPGEFAGSAPGVTLELKNKVERRDNVNKMAAVPKGSPVDLSGLVLSAEAAANATSTDDNDDKEDKSHYVKEAVESSSPALNRLGDEAKKRVQKLLQTITSELHSRASFSVACLTLVLLGAALGILMRGRNPLAVFVVGFVPAIILVLLITAGRQVAENSPRNIPTGVALIWAGNAIILVMVAVAYSKLLRH